MGDILYPMNFTCLCPLCNQIFPVLRYEQLKGMCPYCMKHISRSCIVYANTEKQSLDLARALQEENALKDSDEA